MMKTFTLPAIILLTFLVCGCASPDAGKARQLIESIEKDYNMGEYIGALNTLHEYVRASDAGEIPDNPANDASAYKYLGNIHFIYFDYPTAIKWYEKALEKSSHLPDNAEHLKATYNLCVTHCLTGNKKEARSYADRIASLSNVDSGLRTYSTTMAEAFYEKHFGDWRVAVDKMKEAVKLVEIHDLNEYLKFTPYAELSTYLEELGKYEEALVILSKLEKELEIKPIYPSMLMECMKGYMSVYTKLGDSKNALTYQNRYLQVSDSLMNHNRFIKANNTFHQKDSQSGINTRQDTASMLYSTLIVVGLLSTGGLLFYLIVRFRNRSVIHPAEASHRTDITHTDPEIPEQQQELFKRICNIVDSPEGYANPEYNIEKLAQALDTNIKYVSQAVNICAGTNFRTFLNDRRIREAIARLRTADEGISIHEIAYKVGFASQSAFIASFKRVAGTTPSRFQKMLHDKKGPSTRSYQKLTTK